MNENCKRCFKKMSEFLDGELDAPACVEIRKHLLECRECHDCFESLKKTVDICKKLPDQQIPEEMRQNLRTALRDYLGKNIDRGRTTRSQISWSGVRRHCWTAKPALPRMP